MPLQSLQIETLPLELLIHKTIGAIHSLTLGVIPYVIFLIYFLFKKKLTPAKKTLMHLSFLFIAMQTKTVLKEIIKAPLPSHTPYGFTDQDWQSLTQKLYGFPSGHTVLYCCVFLFLYYTLKLELKTPRQITIMKVLLSTLLSLRLAVICTLGYHHLWHVSLSTAIYITAYIYIMKKQNEILRSWCFYLVLSLGTITGVMQLFPELIRF